MIAFLRGRVAARGPDWAEMDVGGIGFRVAISSQAAAALPAPGEPATVRTALVVREDGVLLFGFRDEAERAAFAALTAVASVGPKTALAVLSGFTPEALAGAIESEDVAALTRVPGIGKKTAQRLVLELKGQFSTGAEVSGTPSAPEAGPAAEAQAALVALGYGTAEAAAAVERVRREAPEAGAMVRAALRSLGGGR